MHIFRIIFQNKSEALDSAFAYFTPPMLRNARLRKIGENITLNGPTRLILKAVHQKSLACAGIGFRRRRTGTVFNLRRVLLHLADASIFCHRWVTTIRICYPLALFQKRHQYGYVRHVLHPALFCSFNMEPTGTGRGPTPLELTAFLWTPSANGRPLSSTAPGTSRTRTSRDCSSLFRSSSHEVTEVSVCWLQQLMRLIVPSRIIAFSS